MASLRLTHTNLCSSFTVLMLFTLLINNSNTEARVFMRPLSHTCKCSGSHNTNTGNSHTEPATSLINQPPVGVTMPELWCQRGREVVHAGTLLMLRDGVLVPQKAACVQTGRVKERHCSNSPSDTKFCLFSSALNHLIVSLSCVGVVDYDMKRVPSKHLHHTTNRLRTPPELSSSLFSSFSFQSCHSFFCTPPNLNTVLNLSLFPLSRLPPSLFLFLIPSLTHCRAAPRASTHSSLGSPLKQLADLDF